jgi:hypothetical protein
MHIRVLGQSIVLALALCAWGSANAGLFRAYLSLKGNDANPCTLQLPCRLLPAAINAVNDGGEIWMVDSANFNTGPVNVGKSVTILAIPGALGSVVASGGDGVVVNGADVEVTLRNLVLLEFAAGGSGVNFVQGAQLTVENCEIYGMPESGIYAHAPGGALAISDTVIRNNLQSGVNVVGPVNATLDRIQLLSNGDAGLSALQGAKVALSDSVVANQNTTGASSGVMVSSSSGAQTQVVVQRSILRANSIGVNAQTADAGAIVQLALVHDVISQNSSAYGATGVGGSSIVTLLDDNTITHNATGVSVGFGTVNTRQNNTFLFNGTDVIGGVLTSLSAQ